MSRIGKLPIIIRDSVEIRVSGQTVRVKGPLGELSRDIHPLIEVKLDGDMMTVHPRDESGFARALHGLSRSLLNNMVVGVHEGFSKELEIVGIGYKAEQTGEGVKLSVGFSHPINYVSPEGIKIEVTSATTFIVKGIDKELVGRVAAIIREFRPPEPYKGKGIRYKDERVRRKVAKTVGIGM
jgi:large subunit ribosomal protein L6